MRADLPLSENLGLFKRFVWLRISWPKIWHALQAGKNLEYRIGAHLATWRRLHRGGFLEARQPVWHRVLVGQGQRFQLRYYLSWPPSFGVNVINSLPLAFVFIEQGDPSGFFRFGHLIIGWLHGRATAGHCFGGAWCGWGCLRGDNLCSVEKGDALKRMARVRPMTRIKG